LTSRPAHANLLIHVSILLRFVMPMRYLKSVVLVGFLLAALLLVAFGPRPALSHPEGRVVVQYWEKWTGDEGAAMQKIVDDFNNTVGAEKHIYVQYLSLSKVDQKILIATSAGTPPDIAGIWNSQLQPFAAIDALQPLDEMAAKYGINEGYYKPIYWEQCTYNGKLYALVSTPASTALHWNKRIFLENADKLRAAGCDPTRAPRTIDELNRYAAALVTRDADGRVIDLGFIPQEPGWYVYQLPFWFGGELYDQKTRKLTLNSPECVRAFNWIEGFSKRLGADAITDFRDSSGTFNSPQNAFLTGHAAMVLQGPWMAFYTESLRPKMNRWKHPKEWEIGKTPAERAENYEWAVAPFPSVYAEEMIKSPNFKPDDLIDKGVTYCATDLVGIPRGAKHPREAFEFIAYINRMDVMEKLCKLHCKNTPLARHSDTWYQTHPNPYVEIFDRLASSPNAHTIPPVPTWPMIDEELRAVVQRVGLMQQSPKVALDLAQTRLQAQLDQFRQRHPETQGPENTQ
jgi:ABC-type glycerol-3-phosphate transport system substrate-binding protein